MTPGVNRFGITAQGEAVERIVIGAGDLSAAILTHGAVLQDVRLAGVPHSLTVGSPSLAAYEGRMASCGGIVGPVGNRIAGARAVIDGREYRFDANFLGQHTLHGGSAAMHRRVWAAAEARDDRVTLRLDLPDGQGGFPGNRRVTAEFRIAPPGDLTLTLTAATDAPTLMNLANHSYWRLGDAPTVAGHRLTVHADLYLPASEDLIPTGEIAQVAGTRFDYRTARALMAGAEGLIDTNYCLSDGRGPLRPAARLEGPGGLSLDMETTEPGLQVFDGHILELPQYSGHDGGHYRAYAGVALEAQFWPDAPNHPGFPPILLHPGDAWQQVTRWRFGKAA